MQIPKQIIVGSYVFDVVFKDKVILDENIDEYRDTIPSGGLLEVDGLISEADELIELRRGLRGSRREVTVWHEIIHAIEYTKEIKLSEEDVEKFAEAIVQVLRDNPQLVKKSKQK